MKEEKGFRLKVESLQPTLRYSTFSSMKWLGEGPRPKRYRPWFEWIRTRIFRRKPNWRLYTFSDFKPRTR